MDLEHYLIFERWQNPISEKMIFSLKIENIKSNQKDFVSFINKLCNISYSEHSYINVYKIENENNSFYLNKIAWIKLGELFSL